MSSINTDRTIQTIKGEYKARILRRYHLEFLERGKDVL